MFRDNGGEIQLVASETVRLILYTYLENQVITWRYYINLVLLYYVRYMDFKSVNCLFDNSYCK